MGEFDDVTPGNDFEADWARWQKILREWRQNYDTWHEVLAQLQEWDEKDSKGIVLASLDPNFDVFGIADISDIGEGEPLCGNFAYEDWALLRLKIELHLLVHHFRNDTGGAVLDLSNLAHYYNCYFKKELTPAAFAAKNLGDVVALVPDAVVIENTLLEHRLPHDTAAVHFLKLTEQQRRDRNQARDAGDETLVLSFPGAKKDNTPSKKKPPQAREDRAKKPPSQSAANTSSTARSPDVSGLWRQKRGPIGSETLASKAPRTRYSESDNRDIGRTWGRDDYGDKPPSRYSERTGPEYVKERDRYSHVPRGHIHEIERYDRYGNDHLQNSREAGASYGRATTGNHGAIGEAARSARQTSSYDRQVPARSPVGGNSRGSSATPGDDHYGESYHEQGSSYGSRAVLQYSGRDGNSGMPQGRAGSTYGRGPVPSHGKAGTLSTGHGTGSVSGYGKSAPPAYGAVAPGYGKSGYSSRVPPRPQPKVALDPLDAFMAGMESHGEKFATGEVEEKKAPANQYDQRYGGPLAGPKSVYGGGKSGSLAGSSNSYSGRINTNDL